MIFIYTIVTIIFNIVIYSGALQSGFTCETSVKIGCPNLNKIVIVEVIYSSECPNLSSDLLPNNYSIYAPSRCIGYYRQPTANLCNGQETCVINNNFDQRPSFFVGQNANCAFKGQSINVEYFCIPEFNSNTLPHVDICSKESLDDIQEGFIHTPNYPNVYPNKLICSKTIPLPESGYRLKIYAINFDIGGTSLVRGKNTPIVNDWLEINHSGEKLHGKRTSLTLLFDDIIQASLIFNTGHTNAMRNNNGFLLYFIIAPIRRFQPSIRKLTSSTVIDRSTNVILQKEASALINDNRRESNTHLILVIVLLSACLFLTICGVLLYKRRNDRRIRYLRDTFNLLSRSKPKSVKLDSIDKQYQIKLNPMANLLSNENNEKANVKLTDEYFSNSDHVYSQDPLENYVGRVGKANEDAIIYETIKDDHFEQLKFDKSTA